MPMHNEGHILEENSNIFVAKIIKVFILCFLYFGLFGRMIGREEKKRKLISIDLRYSSQISV